MTEIRWRVTDRSCYIRAAGHAGFNPGNDIVCAAVSTLLQTLYAGLDGVCGASVVEQHDSGFMMMLAYCMEENRKEVHSLFQSIVLGLELIAGEHWGYVKVVQIGEGETEK